MMTQEMVHAFHVKMGLPHRIGKTPQFADEHARLDFALEEVHELSKAIRLNDFAGAVDALADKIYFDFGTADRWGVNLHPILEVVHQANMRKEPGRVHAVKLEKPPGWRPPDIDAALRRQGWDG